MVRMESNYFGQLLVTMLTFVGGFGGWSKEGCYLDSDESTDTHTVCKCHHLTNFAIMMVSRVVELG